MPAGHNPRILFLGNIAQNGYLLTKFLRRAGVRGRFAHLPLHAPDGPAGVGGRRDPAATRRTSTRSGRTTSRDEYRRPAWVREIRWPPGPCLDGAEPAAARGAVAAIRPTTLSATHACRLAARFQERFGAERGPCKQATSTASSTIATTPAFRGSLPPVRRVHRGGLRRDLPMLLAPGRPYFAFEHGTMRNLPFENSAWGRLLALAYDQADACIITNPDCIASALRLGLCNFRSMPHPIDYKYIDPSPAAAARAIAGHFRRAAGLRAGAARLGHQGQPSGPHWLRPLPGRLRPERSARRCCWNGGTKWSGPGR